jgi:hypothetical protein
VKYTPPVSKLSQSAVDSQRQMRLACRLS